MRKLLVLSALLGVTYLSPTSAADPVNADVVARAKQAVTAQYALSDLAPESIAEDAVYQYSLAEYGLRRNNVNLRVEGRLAVLAYLRALADNAPKATISNLQVFPTLEPDIVFVQYDLTPADGGKQTMPLAIVEMRGKEIVKYTQLNRSPAVLQALEATVMPIN